MQPSSVALFGATLSSFRENNKKRKFPYAFNTTAPTTAVLVTPAVCTFPKWQFARVSNTFTLNYFPNLFKLFVHIFQYYYVDIYSSTYINAQAFVSVHL